MANIKDNTEPININVTIPIEYYTFTDATWMEIDPPPSVITVGQYVITATGEPGGLPARSVYKILDIIVAGDFTFCFKGTWDATTASPTAGSSFAYFALTNGSTDIVSMQQNHDGIVISLADPRPTYVPRIRMWNYYPTTPTTQQYQIPLPYWEGYFVTSRVGTLWTMDIYADAEHTQPLTTTKSLTVNTPTSFTHLIAHASDIWGNSGTLETGTTSWMYKL